MNEFIKNPIQQIGYNFIAKEYLQKGKDEFYIRNIQRGERQQYKPLTEKQIQQLIQNQNECDNWENILVAPKFDAKLVQRNRFHGKITIGNLSANYHEFHNFKMREGIYDSTIISSDIGNHVCIEHVRYLSHYIVGNEVMIANVNELATTEKAKFGNGILKDGETDEKQRMVIEVCNENGGRKIIPFDGMLAGDAYLWSKNQGDQKLIDGFVRMTDAMFNKQRGFYGTIGDRTVIKNCGIIKDTKIGTDAYIKGANKLKNLTLNSDAERKSQIGEGCELVNGIVGYGCRIFYGVKAVRFIAASHSQLKYGARLINSYLGNNSTISCCEVLNSLIYPSHEQHHNNSFLCASLIKGQSNIAAGATLGSNHNSRSADGEIIAERGFWPGLCVSLKHNSKFASFTILAKGDYPSELNIPLPFCLVSHDVANDRLVVMPAYWFMYNMYALARNAQKYADRDQRIQKSQQLEFDYLAPDTINEMADAIAFLQKLTVTDKGEASVKGWENSNRIALLIKVPQAIAMYKKMIATHLAAVCIEFVQNNKNSDFPALKKALDNGKMRSKWTNVGGQLIIDAEIEKLKAQIRDSKIKSWDKVHQFYQKQAANYELDKAKQAWAAYVEVFNLKTNDFTEAFLCRLLNEHLNIQQEIVTNIYKSREKDYSNPFRKMMYDTVEEMNAVLGDLENNGFIKDQENALIQTKKQVQQIKRKWKLSL
jgi:hypothetical protein